MSRTSARDFVVVTCAISAGVHAALTPAHLRESPFLGAGFLVSVPLLAGVIVALRRYPERLPAALAAILLAGLIVAYAATRLTHLPGIADTPEPIDAIGLATKLIESAALLLAFELAAEPDRQTLTRLSLLSDGGHQ